MPAWPGLVVCHLDLQGGLEIDPVALTSVKHSDEQVGILDWDATGLLALVVDLGKVASVSPVLQSL
jgi:hypothetical protein